MYNTPYENTPNALLRSMKKEDYANLAYPNANRQIYQNFNVENKLPQNGF